MSNKLIIVRQLIKIYPLPDGELRVLDGIDFDLDEGDLVAIMGASGVGKTTFLNILGTLDRPTSGQVLFENEEIFKKNPGELAKIRNKKIGFVFQFFHLLPEFTVLENLSLPLLIAGWPRKKALEKAKELLKEVGLETKAKVYPNLLSGGEQQRIAIARALMAEPRLLLADEPTGNLDWGTGEKIMELLARLHRERGLTSVVVTHNDKVAQFCHRRYRLEAGRLKPLEGITSLF
ncbi:MAG: ABC transporter ATP-binding protein [Candidatus Aminicenantes bacterium]|nr:ABC transporter ATP-binding protein [Candidatus Aminicenantes bacterium]